MIKKNIDSLFCLYFHLLNFGVRKSYYMPIQFNKFIAYLHCIYVAIYLVWNFSAQYALNQMKKVSF